MKIKCISCEALARIVYLCAAQSPHTVDVSLLQIGLHDKPDDLRTRLQGEIDDARGGSYDVLALAYGLCGKASEGITARDIPLVMPRAHDCITLFLGGRDRYEAEFNRCPGTYWYSLDYLERSARYGSVMGLGAGLTDVSAVYDEYVRKFGKDNADYLVEVMSGWQSHYKRAVYIDMGIGDGKEIEARAEQDAQKRGWTFERMAGDLILIRRLLNGDWEHDFLTVHPGQQVRMTATVEVMRAVPVDDG